MPDAIRPALLPFTIVMIRLIGIQFILGGLLWMTLIPGYWFPINWAEAGLSRNQQWLIFVWFFIGNCASVTIGLLGIAHARRFALWLIRDLGDDHA